ncbi:hypothetical protein Tco_0990359 [Tanacetum coccineum]|uniref:Uncharacterized protein n=1 Tax=Tanacetum coccineum TaxID=301880 RepID=A0ABQ5EXD8_9ASTR
MKRGFRGASRPLLPAMLLVATTNPNAGQEHHAVAQSQPSSSTLPAPSILTYSSVDIKEWTPGMDLKPNQADKWGMLFVSQSRSEEAGEWFLKRRNMFLSDSEAEVPGLREGKVKMILLDRKEDKGKEGCQSLVLRKEVELLVLKECKILLKELILAVLNINGIAEEEDLNEQQKKRRAQTFHFEAQTLQDEDWDLIRAKIEANAELSKSMLGSDLQGEDFAKKMVDLVNQRKKYFAEEREKS